MHNILRLFRSEKCLSMFTGKIRRAFPLEGSFNKINKFTYLLSCRSEGRSKSIFAYYVPIRYDSRKDISKIVK